MTVKQIISGLFLFVAVACSQTSNHFTKEENSLILLGSEAEMMRLLQTDNDQDSLFLRQKAQPITAQMNTTQQCDQLKKRMLLTVNNPDNAGVGLAAPQVGLSRELILVQRLDKACEPFEFYLNPKIIFSSSDTIGVEEGCLSLLHQKQYYVPRSRRIVLQYNRDSDFVQVQDTVSDITAIVFQHEIDHLNGVIYTDRKK